MSPRVQATAGIFNFGYVDLGILEHSSLFGNGWGADEVVVVWGRDEPGDVVGSNSGIATMIMQKTSIPLSKKRYKKLGITKFVLDYLLDYL
jgi:hypothetical protein